MAITTAAVTIGSNAGVAVTFSGNITSNVTVALNAAGGSTVTFSGNLNLGLGGETIQGGGTVVESGIDAYTGTDDDQCRHAANEQHHRHSEPARRCRSPAHAQHQ